MIYAYATRQCNVVLLFTSCQTRIINSGDQKKAIAISKAYHYAVAPVL